MHWHERCSGLKKLVATEARWPSDLLSLIVESSQQRSRRDGMHVDRDDMVL